MKTPNPISWRRTGLSIISLIALLLVVGAAVYGLSRILTGTLGGAVAGGLVAIAVTVVSKLLERRQQHESAIAEKKRDVYRRLLAPWQQVLVDIKAGKHGEELLANVDLAEMYASAFDAVLYGSESVVQRYVAFRSTDPARDGIDALRDLAALLLAMREDVTGKKSTLPAEAVVGTFMNLSDAELVLLRLREYVRSHPEAQRQLAHVLAGTGMPPVSETGGPGKG